MELTAEQRRVADHDGPRLRVVGPPGSGRTTSLVARYLRLVASGHRPRAILVVCPNRNAAARFQDSVLLPHLSGAFDALPATTWFGVAFDLVTRGQGPVRLLSSAEQRSVVRRLLADEFPTDWPVFSRFLGREAFVDEVALAVLHYQARNEAGGPLVGGWAELARFAARYAAALAARDLVDRAGLVAAAASVARPARYDHVLIDDHDSLPFGVSRLLAGLIGPETRVCAVGPGPVPGDVVEVALTRGFRQPAEPVLVACPHPSTEPEAVAGELLAARAEGVPWSSMAALVRQPGTGGRAVARALGRHGIPVAPGPGLGAGDGDPAVAAIVDLLRWSAGDRDAADRLQASPLSHLGPQGLLSLHDDVAAAAADAIPVDLAFLVWQRGLAHLVEETNSDGSSLDAVVAFLDRLGRDAEENPRRRLPEILALLDGDGLEPDPWRVVRAAGDPEAVTVTSIAASAGREWHTVVLAGCVEGELPRIRGRAPVFEPTLLDDGALPPSAAERRRASLAEERRLFATACSRATGRLVATAAPRPGVLLSRFVEGWPRRDARPPQRPGPTPVARTPTDNDVAVFPGGRLVLSASQLDTYDDCPLRYAYQYGLRVRDEAGAPAALGTLVHEVLAEFLRPDRPPDAPPRSKEELLALASQKWRDDIARYRPQVEECRRDYYAMLEDWWAAEGDGLQAPDVLAVEHRFEIEVGDVRLVGAIDRVDRATGADGDGIAIVDYKTGRNQVRPDALPDDLQLAVYHLAATLDPELGALGPPRHLQLLYLRGMRRLEQPIIAGHAPATQARVEEAANFIREERFEPSVDASCRTCPFHRLCPLQAEGREVGATSR